MGTVDVQAAFRAGLEGLAFREAGRPTGLAEMTRQFAHGPNEELALSLGRMPGLSEPRGAFATGRAARKILKLFDQAGAPASMGQQFLDNLRAATITGASRPGRHAWGAADTVAMFMEMYARVFGADGADYARIEATLLEDALSDPGSADSDSGLLAALRRLRRSKG